MIGTLACLPALAQSPQPVGIAVDPAGLTRMLWDNPDTSAALWQINNDAARSVAPASLAPYGPYGNTFRAKSVAVGPNNVPRLLWTMPDGTAVLWNGLYGQSGFSQTAYGPFSGWTALGVSVGADNKARLLWTCTTGQMSVWTETATPGAFTHDDEGPFTGWTVKSLAVGPDNVAHILWNKTDGTISLWNGTPAANPSTWTNGLYGPYSGWTGAAVAVGGSNVAYILGSKPDGSAQLWTVGSLTSLTGYVYGPYSGWTPRAIGVYPTPGQSASSYAVQMLWAQAGGVTSLWTVAANGSFTQVGFPTAASLSLSPATVIMGSSTTGTVTLNVPALPSGAVVSLNSSNPAVTVPSSITVPSGSNSATFTVTTSNVTTSTSVTITATCNGVNQATALLVQGPSFTVSPDAQFLSLRQGTSAYVRVTVSSKVGFSGPVTLSSSTLPAGVIASFSPTQVSITPTSTLVSTMTLSAYGSAPISTTSLTLIGTSGSISNSSRIELAVTTQPRIAISPDQPHVPASSQVPLIATAYGDDGHKVSPQPLLTWAATGGTISLPYYNQGDTNHAIFMAGSTLGSNFSVMASAPNYTSIPDPITIVSPSSLSLSSVSVSPSTVTGGASATGTVTLTGAAPAAGTMVTLTSSTPQL